MYKASVACVALGIGQNWANSNTILLLQELSNELSTIRKLLAGVATHAAANMPEALS